MLVKSSTDRAVDLTMHAEQPRSREAHGFTRTNCGAGCPQRAPESKSSNHPEVTEDIGFNGRSLLARPPRQRLGVALTGAQIVHQHRGHERRIIA